MLKLFNTETRKKETLQPMEKGHVKLYTCGPTVYNYAHIGNFRTYVFEDLLRRTLQFFGLKVSQVMNLTDVDDKTIKGAVEKEISLLEYTEPFKKAFFNDLELLHIQHAEYYPCATDYIPQMVELIQRLLEKGYAYKTTDGSVYYSIVKFHRYGCLSHLPLEELKSGASERVIGDEYDKEHVSDFVLWKSYDAKRDGHVFWESPFGRGRPGWHLECSAMAMNILGERIDIHVGGVDNIFPHHENEIAQSEAYSEKRFVNLWMHSEHLIVDGKKMSKSLGNVYTMRDLIEKGYTGTQVRYMLLQTHYRTQLNFTFTGMQAVQSSLERLQNFIQRLQEVTEGNESRIDDRLTQAQREFSNALADDLNISPALAGLFDLVRDVNGYLEEGRVSKVEAEKVLSLLRKFNEVLDVLHFDTQQALPQELEEALKQREEARRTKNWAEADRLRDLIHSGGYTIEDTPKGPRLKKGNL